jgi:hypothetical protein
MRMLTACVLGNVDAVHDAVSMERGPNGADSLAYVITRAGVRTVGGIRSFGCFVKKA